MGDSRIDNLKEVLDDTEETVEEEETTETDSEEETAEDDAEETEEEESTEEEEDDSDEEEETEDDDDEFEVPEKFKGKSPKEIIKSYQELEKLVGQRTLTKGERKALKDAGLDRNDLGKMDDLKKVLEGTDFSKMSPAQFAQFIIDMTDKRAQAQAKEIYQNASTVKQAVNTEIKTATEKFPLLQTNKEFRDLVLAVIEADASRDEVTPIVTACEKVSAMMGAGEKINKKKTIKKKAKRTPVERSTTGNETDKETDEDKVKSGILGAGSPTDVLGGLGA